MTTLGRRFVIVLGLVSLWSLQLPVSANYLTNTDFKGGLEGWHGDGESAFLKPDGTEGTELDAGAIPVIKIVLSKGHARAVFQECETHDKPINMHVSVDAFASSDFKRSTFATDYSGPRWSAGGLWYWSGLVIPNVDFWMRGGPGWFYKLINLKPGAWTTLDGRFEGLNASDTHVINFCVPPGDGTVYIKNPVAEP